MSIELRRAGRELREFLKPFLLMILFMGVFRSAIADWHDVPTGSMKPTILEGDRIVVEKVAYDLKLPLLGHSLAQLGAPERGDIIVFTSPRDGQRLVKRVVGIAGDRIEMRRNQLSVGGVPVSYAALEPIDDLTQRDKSSHHVALEHIGPRAHSIMTSVHPSAGGTFGPIIVPDDHVFVLGDNRDNSLDSRWIGFIHRDAIQGRATSVALSVDAEHSYRPRWGRFLTRLH